MMRNHNIINSGEYNGYPLYQGKKSHLGAHGEILDVLYRALTCMTSARRWTFVFTLTLNFPINHHPQGDNQHLMSFLRRFVEQLPQQGAYQYVWCREQDRGIHPHFHIAFFVDGDRIFNGWPWKDKATNMWGYLLGTMLDQYDGLVQISCPEELDYGHAPRYGLPVAYGMMIDARAATAQERKQEVFQWISYLAKVASKSPVPGCRSYGSSRL